MSDFYYTYQYRGLKVSFSEDAVEVKHRKFFGKQITSLIQIKDISAISLKTLPYGKGYLRIKDKNNVSFGINYGFDKEFDEFIKAFVLQLNADNLQLAKNNKKLNDKEDIISGILCLMLTIILPLILCLGLFLLSLKTAVILLIVYGIVLFILFMIKYNM